MSGKCTRIIKYSCSFVLMLLLLVAVASAQTSNGTIAGVVADPNGAVIANASVTAVNKDNGEKHVATTNSQGSYRIESVTPGPYTITFKAANFAELKLQNVIVTASVVTTAEGRLKIGTSETVVEIEAIGQQLQTESGELNHTISTAEITDLVVPGLNPIELVLTEPGVSRPGNFGFSNGFDFSVNGTRPRANNFLIEGSDNNDTAIQGQAFQTINLEAIKEVSIQTNSYAAEFGHGGGSVTNEIYKSGTNAWHGSAFDLIQNSALDSNDAQNKLNGTVRPISRENTYGFTIGGPIKRDKLFIFGSNQWDKFRATTNGNPLFLPSATGFATLQALPQTQNLKNYLQALGSLRANANFSPITLGGGRSDVQIGTFQRIGGQPSNDSQLVIKGDYLPSSKDTLALRYTYDTQNISPLSLNNLPGFDTQESGPSHNAGITETHLFSPRVVNELRLSFSRISFAFTDQAQTLANPLAIGPSISISGLTGFGAPGGIPQGRTHDVYQYQDSVSLNTGKHSFKFGVDLTQIKVVDLIPFNSFGSINYAPSTGASAAFSGLANFIDNFSGVNGSVSRAFGSPVTRPQYFYQNYYAQDTWKLKSNLSVDLGIRYEYGGTPENNLLFPAVVPVQGFNGASSITFVPQQPAKNNWAPRAGFAYTPHFWSGLFGQDKTVIRGGFGVFFDSFFTNIIDNSAASSPNAVSPVIVGTKGQNNGRGFASASTQFVALNPTPSPTTGVTTVANNLKAPTTLQWNFNIQRDLGAKFTLTTSYVGTRGERLFANDQLNPGDPNGTTGTLRINPLLGPVTVRDNSGDSIYHALDLKLDRRFSNGLLVRGAYTYSKLIDDASEVFTTTGTTSFPADLALGKRGIDRGLSAYNHTHVASLTYIYDIPRLKSEGVLLKGVGYITNGWQTSGTYEYQTGAPNTVNDGFDSNGDQQGNDRPNLSNPNAPIATYAVDFGLFGGTPGTLCDGPSIFHAKGCVVVPASSVHFIIPASGIGTLGRNSVIDPGQQNTTFGLQRSFNLYSEKHQLAFRMEMLNPFNHPNTGSPNYSLVGIPIPKPGVTTTFANYPLTESGSRTIRFRLRYSF
ncbi:MAG TPA: carboxypeptidase regulatory-like domain-containing protein [Candidatus Angelobacter sp.]|nr:carboxypeptidase regulatory-like domain-containing protein [Candidatus Angelobacter sp.]